MQKVRVANVLLIRKTKSKNDVKNIVNNELSTTSRSVELLLQLLFIFNWTIQQLCDTIYPSRYYPLYLFLSLTPVFLEKVFTQWVDLVVYFSYCFLSSFYHRTLLSGILNRSCMLASFWFNNNNKFFIKTFLAFCMFWNLWFFSFNAINAHVLMRRCTNCVCVRFGMLTGLYRAGANPPDEPDHIRIPMELLPNHVDAFSLHSLCMHDVMFASLCVLFQTMLLMLCVCVYVCGRFDLIITRSQTFLLHSATVWGLDA